MPQFSSFCSTFRGNSRLVTVRNVLQHFRCSTNWNAIQSIFPLLKTHATHCATFASRPTPTCPTLPCCALSQTQARNIYICVIKIESAPKKRPIYKRIDLGSMENKLGQKNIHIRRSKFKDTQLNLTTV